MGGTATFGPQSWLTGIFTASIGTARDNPQEYGPHTGKVLRNATVCVLPVSLPVTPSRPG